MRSIRDLTICYTLSDEQKKRHDCDVSPIYRYHPRSSQQNPSHLLSQSGVTLGKPDSLALGKEAGQNGRNGARAGADKMRTAPSVNSISARKDRRHAESEKEGEKKGQVTTR